MLQKLLLRNEWIPKHPAIHISKLFGIDLKLPLQQLVKYKLQTEILECHKSTLWSREKQQQTFCC